VAHRRTWEDTRLELNGPGVIGGNAYAMVAPLPADATYDLPIDLEDYWAPTEKMYDLDLPSGR
jgi:hypothetical protein